jgi:hypothetical protein
MLGLCWTSSRSVFLRFKHRVSVMLASALVTCFLSVGHAAEIESLNDRFKTIPNWSKDPSEVGYVLARCGVLLLLISEVFKSDTREKDDMVSIATQNAKKARELVAQGFEISRSVGASQSLLDRRVQQLFSSYRDQIVRNRAVHNNIFHGIVGQDFVLCRAFL